MHRAFRSDPADVEMYYKKLVAAHGESSVTTTVVAARMNAARKTNDWVRVHELAAEAEQQGIDTLPLQTIVMDAFWAQGDEASAMRQFHAFVDAPSQRPLDIARAYSWLANLYLRGGRLTEAEATINALEARGVRTNPAAEAIRARVAMARGDLQAATAGVRETIRASRRETFTAVVTELVHAYVAAKDLEGLHKFYKYYAGEYERIHDLRFGPFVIGIQAYTTPENIAQYLPYAEEVFEMIPIQGKYKNSAILKAVVDGYLQAGKVEQAKALVNTASKKGFRVAVPSIEYIDNHSKRMADRAARESANAATSAAHFAATKVAIVAETKVADDAAPAVEAKAADAPIVEKAAAAAAPDVEKPAAAAAEAPKAEVKIEETNAETPKAEVPKTEATKTEAPAAAAPEVDAPKVTAGAPKAAAAQK
ncbi:hypothetical protein BC828DRAFT_177997 [Blastocladiella britannica]|nr:hypothetical protein BC828DRAFT_177997 [Blastocladiella britannica]